MPGTTSRKPSSSPRPGCPGAITIATNMAGRGTDIQLGGNVEMRIRQELADLEDGGERTRAEARITNEVEALKDRAIAAGGLFVVATERHESRRIDNQLRGRSGRQGDPGRSKFFLSLEDDLMRIFGSERMDGMLQKLGLKEGEAIVHPWINKALERAQQKVEARNFDIRKNLLKYDNVMNDQRKVVFEQRIELMAGDTVAETVVDMRHDVIDSLVAEHIPEKAYAEQWDMDGLHEQVKSIFDLDLPVQDWAQEEGIAEEEVRERLMKATDEAAARKAAEFGPDVMRQIEKSLLLQILDHLWREHLQTLDNLRSVVHLRGYGQRDPLNEYKTESFTLFQALLSDLRRETTGTLMHVELAPPPEQMAPQDLPEIEAHHIDATTGEDIFEMAEAGAMAGANGARMIPGAGSARRAPSERDPDNPTTWGKVGRNEPCPCGSGKKYKHCHGRLA